MKKSTRPLPFGREKGKGKSAQPPDHPGYKGSGFRVLGFGFRVLSFGFRVSGSGFNAWMRECVNALMRGCVNASMRKCVPRPTAPMDTHYGGKDVGPFHFSRLFDHE